VFPGRSGFLAGVGLAEANLRCSTPRTYDSRAATGLSSFAGEWARPTRCPRPADSADWMYGWLDSIRHLTILRPSPIPNEECEAPSGHSYEADDKDDVAAMMDHPGRRPSPRRDRQNQSQHGHPTYQLP